MRLYTALVEGRETVLVSYDGGVTAVPVKQLGFDFDDMNSLILALGENGAEELKKAASLKLAGMPLEGVKLCSPIPRPLKDIVCLGVNFAEHANDAKGFTDDAAASGTSAATIYFAKHVKDAIGPEDAIPSHSDIVESLDYEVELGVILGKEASKVKKEDAFDYVFGYTVFNDVSARNLQFKHAQWFLGKSLDGFTAMGPCIVTPDELGDPAKLGIRSIINGEVRQNSNTSVMIQTIEGAIEELSAGMTLEAGTIIAMGTPAGVGMGQNPPAFLKHGDEVVCEIEKIGKLVNTVD